MLQDFSMPHVSNLVKVTNDNEYVITAGTYKPRLRVYDTNQMSLKYEKVMDSHAIQLVCLEEDYSKVEYNTHLYLVTAFYAIIGLPAKQG